MDLMTFIQLYKQKTGRNLNINELIRAMNGSQDTFNDSGNWGNKGFGNLWEQKFWETNDPQQLGDADRRNRRTGEFEDYNLMYNRLNDLYRADPTMHREAQRMLLDQGLHNDVVDMQRRFPGKYKM